MLNLMRTRPFRGAEVHPATVVGIGGGRGAAKSSGADRCAITLMYESEQMGTPINILLVMRTWTQQIVPFHLEPLRTTFPWLTKDMRMTSPAVIRIGRSTLTFKFAQNLEDVKQSFQSGNFDLTICDQGEQFSGDELREMRRATRSTVGIAKLVILHNMRGAYLPNLRDWFHLRKVGPLESPDDYVFLRINPWDNVEWVRAALTEKGYTDEEYYSWTDEQRKWFAAKYGPYTKQLATDNPAISKADWEGDWDSQEGCYFQHSFDLNSTQISAGKVEALRKPTATHWMSGDWGVGHYWSTYWHFRVALSPSEIQTLLGWTVDSPLNVTVTYREMITNEKTPDEMARLQIAATPLHEQKKIRAYHLSPEVVTGEPGSIGNQQAQVLRAAGMPGPIKADNDRVGGWSLMARLLRGTRYAGHDPSTLRITCNMCGHQAIAASGAVAKCAQCGSLHLRATPTQCSDVWLISAECPTLLEAIPKAVHDPAKLDDILKTDKTSADKIMDSLDGARYGLKTMLAPRRKTAEDLHRERLEAAETPAEKTMIAAVHFLQEKHKPRGYWANRFRRRAVSRT